MKDVEREGREEAGGGGGVRRVRLDAEAGVVCRWFWMRVVVETEGLEKIMDLDRRRC